MKKVVLIFMWVFLQWKFVAAQSEEAQQLLLNVEKLAQFKKILTDMKKAYDILYKGYTTIRDISSGSFNLHKNFLDALLQVSPGVRKYKRIADIVSYQLRIVKQAKAAFNEFGSNGQFTADEIQYLSSVYSGLIKASLRTLDELAMIITAGKLRMSDDERLQAIDRIYASVEDQFSFLQEFNNQTSVLVMQRKSEQAEIDYSRRIRGF
ncbi:MAG: TerB family tellurite resistance protein [Chitinophagaceae bacterium]